MDKTRHTQGKINIFSVGHVRKFFQRRPWGHDQITLAEHIAATWSDGVEFEVDEVVDRKFAYGKYKYSVSFKGRSGDHSRYLPRGDDKLSGCQQLISAYDEQFPLGSLRLDESSDKWRYDVAHKATRKSGRLTNREVVLTDDLSEVIGGSPSGWRRSAGGEGRSPAVDSGTSTCDFHEFTRANKLQRRKAAVARWVTALTTGRDCCEAPSTVRIEEIFEDG